ncbi:MAG: M48 family metalloprotease [Pseudomonadota bacterium]
MISIRTITAGLLASVMLAGCVQPQQGAPREPTAPLPQTTSSRSQQQQRLGDENHAKILQKYGGAYNDARLTGYVEDLGRRIVAVSEQPAEKWTFTVLDSPTVNAFALPGGYVYVTRGLVGLANSEAELAGVLGHEIGHVTAGHSSLRQERGAIATGALLGTLILGSALGLDKGLLEGLGQVGQVAAAGYLAQYSREDELAADNLGIRYLARAGYDAYAQADFLESMGASAALDAKMAGKSYNPNATDFFASHPATGDRTRRAIQIARSSGQIGPLAGGRDPERYLSAIDGMLFGDSPEQGFVRGRNFSHPVLGFSYDSPTGFRIVNSATAVTAIGPDNARFILDGGGASQQQLTDYIRSTWLPQIAKSVRVGKLRNMRLTRINGLDAAEAMLPMQIQGRAVDALLVAVRLNGKVYRLTGLMQRGGGMTAAFRQAASTFRRLSPGEASRLRPQRIDVVAVRRGDTVARLAAGMNVDGFAQERFRVLNGMKPGEQLRPGQRVKVIR